jgi:hypothetical protein
MIERKTCSGPNTSTSLQTTLAAEAHLAGQFLSEQQTLNIEILWYNNNSVQLFIIRVPSQQLQGQLQTQHSVDTGNCIKGKHNTKTTATYNNNNNNLVHSLKCLKRAVKPNVKKALQKNH